MFFLFLHMYSITNITFAHKVCYKIRFRLMPTHMPCLFFLNLPLSLSLASLASFSLSWYACTQCGTFIMDNPLNNSWNFNWKLLNKVNSVHLFGYIVRGKKKNKKNIAVVWFYLRMLLPKCKKEKSSFFVVALSYAIPCYAIRHHPILGRWRNFHSS